MAVNTSSNDKKTYSKPRLRSRLKEKILKGKKGGKVGQWTARKAQLLVKEYAKAHGTYTRNNQTAQSKKSLNAYNAQAKKESSSKTYKPTLQIAKNAALGLALRKQFKKGGTAIGIKRATDLKKQKGVSISLLKRMHSYFARHAVDKRSKNFGSHTNPSAGYIAWLLWGGDVAQAWVQKKLRSFQP